MPRFGVHNSIAGGLTNALDIGVRLGCDCVQMFVKNQRQWRARPLTAEQIAAWKARRAETAGIAPIVAHGSYLVNLAAANPLVRDRSYAAFLDEFDRCDLLGIDYLVIHPGSHGGAGDGPGIARLVESLNRLTTDRPVGKTIVLLETTAGQGTGLGHRFEQLAEVLGCVAQPPSAADVAQPPSAVIFPPPAGTHPRAGVQNSSQPRRFGVCLDTCHVFAAGYDIRTPQGVGRTVDEFDSIVGLARLMAIHVNDSKRELGSRVDRHEHIGRGCIGDAGFWSLTHAPRLADMPMILETPKATDPKTGLATLEWDAINLAHLRALARRKTMPRS